VRILSRTLVASYLILFVAILSASLLAIGILEVMLHFDDISIRGGGLAGAARWIGVRIPAYYLRDLLPLASFAAAFLCLGIPARHSEIRGALAGGISPLRLALPVLGAALLLSVLALGVEETLVVHASRAWLGLEAAGDVASGRGPFWYHTGDRIYNVGSREAGGDTLRDVEIYQLAPRGRLLARIRAERARLDPDRRWHLAGARRISFDPEHPTAAPRVERLAELVLEPGAGELPAEPDALSLPALAGSVARLEQAGAPALRERARLHARLADPLGVWIFALLAAPLGLAVERRRGLSGCALRGGLALGAFFSARALGSLAVLAGVTAAVWTPWLLAGLVVLCGGFQLLRALRV
jgi:lipopolysaccharide export LptBFGC system permease protein LptF